MSEDINLKTEETLLLCLARLVFSKEQVQKINDLILSVTDWSYFINLANEHGIAALVYHNLENLGFLISIPYNIRETLHNFFMLNLSRNTFHKTALEELLHLLNSEGIKVILIKGFALEMMLYGNKGLRQMTDLDILVDRNDYWRARKILLSDGYISQPVKSIFHESIISWIGKHLPTLRKNGVSFDLHLELFGERKNNLTRQISTNSGEIDIGGEKAYIPPPQLFFLYLIKHLYFHEIKNESQLRLYTDLVALIEKYREEIVNDRLITLATDAGLAGIMAQRLELLREFMGVSFPPWIDSFIKEWVRPESRERFIFFVKKPKDNGVEFPGYLYRTVLKEIPGIHRKILFVLGDIFPSIRFMKERYRCTNPWKALLYYPLRIGKMLYLFSR